MAWANKYLFKFNSIHGVEHRIYIQQDGYSGDVIQRAIGRPPVLRKKQNGPVCGTSLELWAECAVNGEFAELYTSDPKEFRVNVYRGDTLIWTGFVSTELYSEPGIAPPYDVEIVATDGLGELKLVDFEPQGEVLLTNMLAYLLSFTNTQRNFRVAWDIKEYGGTVAALLTSKLNLDYMEGKNCYEVLTYVLESFHAVITAGANYWLITRETDLPLSATSMTVYYFPYTGGSVISNLTITGEVKTLGKMGTADLWPVGNYSTKIEPARKTVTVSSQWHTANLLTNPQLKSALGGWTFSGHGGYLARVDGGAWLGDHSSHDPGTVTHGKMSQSIQLDCLKNPIKLSFTVNGYGRSTTDQPTIVVYVSYVANGTTYWADADGWRSSEPSVPQRTLHEIARNNTAVTFEETIENPDIDDAGTLTVYFYGTYNVSLSQVYLSLELPNFGYKDILHLDNGARGDDDEVEVLHGRIDADEVQKASLLLGALKKVVSNEDTYIYKFADAHYSNADFLSLAGLSYALSAALPRVRREGTFNVPASLATIPLFLTVESVRHFVETWDWDLRNEEARFSALSLPAASLTVESEEVVPLTSPSGTASGSGGSSGGGSSSGGGGGSSSGTNLLQVWRSLTNNDALVDYGASTPIDAAHLSSIFTVQGSGASAYLKLAAAFAGLVADGYITAGASASSSDRRLKDDIRDVEADAAREIILKLRPREWTWNEQNPALFGKPCAGLVAQEVSDVLPLAVVPGMPFFAINYDTLHAYEIALLQAQERRIAALEKTVRELKEKLDRHAAE